MSLVNSKRESQLRLLDRRNEHDLAQYPLDMTSFLQLKKYSLDAMGVPCNKGQETYHPTFIAQFALAHWNEYVKTALEEHRNSFLAQASWLVKHARAISSDQMLGWPVTFPEPDFPIQGSYLSATTQGRALSVMVRAYQITQEQVYLDVAERTARTFAQDILDGGVYAPLGVNGIFFEEVAVYPASHALSGHLFALSGLLDYQAMVNSEELEKHIVSGLRTLAELIKAFDTGFWTYADLLGCRLSTPTEFTLQTQLLETLTGYPEGEQFLAVAKRWRHYQQTFFSRMRYRVGALWQTVMRSTSRKLRTVLFPQAKESFPTRVSIAIPAFPVMGGILTVLEGLAQAMNDVWHIEYLTQHIGPQAEQYRIQHFGSRRMTPWYFPFIWLYVLAGARKTVSLLRKGAGYQVLLPQDGVFTAALSGLAGKLTGVRVVCIDHGDLSLFTERNLQILQTERLNLVKAKPWPQPVRFIARSLLKFYWPSRLWLARLSARLVDHYLIPGVPGDSIEEGCNIVGIQPHRITRYESMIDLTHHLLPDPSIRRSQRIQKGIPADALVVSIICRLSPEKGLDITLESIQQALETLPPEKRTQVRVVIAGDGPSRQDVEGLISQLELQDTCTLWGALTSEQVIELLGISDIFLYTSTRGACYAMAILEAMASGCAVIASLEPLANAVLLAEGRGFAVPSGDVLQTSKALSCLFNNRELCARMGKQARAYIAEMHSPTRFRRTLLRATYWSGLDELLRLEKSNVSTEVESENQP